MSMGVAYTLTVRCEIENRPGMLGRLTTRIGEVGGDIGAIDIVRAERSLLVRDIDGAAPDHLQAEAEHLPFVDGALDRGQVFAAGAFATAAVGAVTV